ncbi:MAG: phytoene synthase [Pelagibacteraceae bacterium BACL5 MAG-121015-bin10]|jgi:15-cis-phytoene synthase|uniref:phytoene/squalene synthase family protein n=1 Tax=Candidatus Pelagibacter sp. TaxID=2024849 RepID=UPI0007128714|nr:MAG: phytoene synthase [Pelagibacteraceae bacterium BACL5 MAG-121015-bin10]
MLTKNYLSLYAKSFNWAGFFLPKKTYEKCSALYDFCRTVDNLADEKNSLEIKKNNFLKFKSDFNSKNSMNPIIINMWKLIDEFQISLKIINDLFDGIETDLKEKVVFNNKKDLLVYSYRVAGTVGLMMAKILNVKNKDALKSAINLGIAMQLTNISRDVVEDKMNNRFYIKENINVIKSTIDLSNIFYDSSFWAIRQIPLSFRFSILVARRVYKRIGYKISKKNTFSEYEASKKIYVTKLEKIYETMMSITDLLKLNFINKNNYTIDKDLDLINEESFINERI